MSLYALVKYGKEKRLANIEDGWLVVEDAKAITAISVCSFYGKDYCVDMSGVGRMPLLEKLLFTYVTVVGLDNVMAHSPKLKAVKAKVHCDDWFVYPRRSKEDYLELYGGCYDMRNMCRGSINCQNIKYIQGPTYTGGITTGKAIVMLADYHRFEPGSEFIYCVDSMQYDGEKDVFATVDALEEHLGETIWSYLGVKPYGYSAAKSARS